MTSKDDLGERGLPLVLPRPPELYDVHFMSEIVRVLDIWARGRENPGPLRATYFFCDDKFPRNGSLLEEGALYIDGDTIKVALPQTGYASSFAMVSALGSVTVTIT